jgi:hypothetical protein
MARVIYFRLGNQDEITFGSLLRMMGEIRGLLADFDAAVSRDPRGVLRWKVAVLQKDSPPLLGLVGETIVRHDGPPPIPPNIIEDAFLESTARLSNEAQRTTVVSDSAMERYRKLATASRKLGEISVYTDDRQVGITEATLDKINLITATKSRSAGSILGRLETISVHKANEIRVWDENTNRPVRCRYHRSLEEQVKALLRERVIVSGEISYNPFGQPTRVDVASIDPYPSDSDLPSIERIAGLVDDFTGGATLKEYLEHLRDE